jgi:rubrerythrin
MEKFKSADEALDFAIKSEEEAHEYYVNLAEKVAKPWMKDLFKGFAREELGHKAKLTEAKKGRILLPIATKILDLKIAEYVEDAPESPDLTLQDALILAMKKEKKSFKLYTDLAEMADTADLRLTFQALANEEAKHKLRIEMIYDDEILIEN